MVTRLLWVTLWYLCVPTTPAALKASAISADADARAALTSSSSQLFVSPVRRALLTDWDSVEEAAPEEEATAEYEVDYEDYNVDDDEDAADDDDEDEDNCDLQQEAEDMYVRLLFLLLLLYKQES